MTSAPKLEKPLRYSLAAAMAQHTSQPPPERKAYSLSDAMRKLTAPTDRNDD